MTSPAGAYAERLLTSLGAARPVPDDSDPVAGWATCGAMALTGRADGPPLVRTGPAVAVRGALLALQQLAPGVELPGPELLGERAAVLGLQRAGDRSCGGASRLLPAADATVCVTLARPDDRELVPALVESEVDEPWDAVAAWLSRTSSSEARERAALLGLPLSVAGEVSATMPWQLVGRPSDAAAPASPLVVDLSSLWAGPLCASLLRLLGCRVVKVEDPQRPDGARRGPPALFDLLNAGAEPEAVDLASDRGRERLRDLVLTADVVIEGSRPRALRQLGISAEEVVAQSERLTWVSITGYGREHDRVGFGDDTAVAGGLVADGCFVADAVADPLTGVHAALAAWAGVCRGGGWLVDVPLAGVAATAAGLDSPSEPPSWREGAWWVETSAGPVRVRDPRARQAPGPGPALAALT